MNTYIALRRNINVGGNNKLPMRDLVSLREGLGLQNVKTYIQSGNIPFRQRASPLTHVQNRFPVRHLASDRYR